MATASEAVLRGQTFFRVFSNIDSTGFLLDPGIDESIHAVAIGPNSDIDMAMVTYVDPTGSNPIPGASSIIISQESPLVAPINASFFPSAPPGSPPGIGIVSPPVPFFAVTFPSIRRVPIGFFGVVNVDLLFYLAPPVDGFPTRRSPRTDFGSVDLAVPLGSTPTILVNFPFYGRRRYAGKLQFHSQLGGGPNTLDFAYVGLKFGWAGLLTPIEFVRTLATAAAVPAGGFLDLNFQDTSNFDFDAIALRITGAAGAAGTVRVRWSQEGRDL